MKFPISNFQSPICRRREKDSSAPGRVTANWRLAIGNRKSRQGIALVITLVLLSVTLIMAVAFLALSRRDRNAVATSTDTAVARLAADSALAAAQAQVVANIFATNRAAYDFKLLVSTNYINAYGFNPAAGANPTNVNYDYYSAAAGPLAANDLIQNIANLWYLPRVPVYPFDRRLGSNDFRYYLDLNRNGRFETNGFHQQFDESGNALGQAQLTGDPEWIGVLERPDQPHGPNNPFVARYAFLAQPIGNSLDLNHIHNQAITRALNVNDGYFRNQGVGSWELNLAGFLADLNTNIWSPDNFLTANYYQFNEPFNFNRGIAFDDARALLGYRYNYNFNNLASAAVNLNGAGDFPYDNIDGYSDGAQQVTTTNIIESFARDNETRPWSGADNPNRFFSVNSDLFDAGKLGTFFTNRLQSTGSSNSTYNRYTYYRMLDQLGTDSSADAGKINLNYSNAIVQYDGNGLVTAISIVPGAETNMVAWRPLDFFNAAANQMLRYYTTQWATNRAADPFNADTNYVANFSVTEPFGITNIPVLVSNRFVYTPAVNRLLQLAANLFDASTNNAARLGKDFPSVFRPVFKKVVNGTFNDIYISGFHEVSALNSFSVGSAPLDKPYEVTDPNLNFNASVTAARGNVYGVPWIVGAKKGFPNFNQLYSRNILHLTRKLQVNRQSVGGPIETNQMFIMSITNRTGYSFWNSYNEDYVPQSGTVTVYFRDIMDLGFTNAQGVYPLFPPPFQNPVQISQAALIQSNIWPGSAWTNFSDPYYQEDWPQKEAAAVSFISGFWENTFLPDSQYKYLGNFEISSQTTFEGGIGFVPILPKFGLTMTNRVQGYILDGNHIIDYVHLAGPDIARNVNSQIDQTTPSATGYWDTNFNSSIPYSGSGPNPPTKGVIRQIESGKNNNVDPSWKKPSNLPAFVTTPALEAAYFQYFFLPNQPIRVNGATYLYNKVQQFNTNLSQQVPYTPTIYAWDANVRVANDPLVHYTIGDLNFSGPADFGTNKNLDTSAFQATEPQLNSVNKNKRYKPWGRALPKKAPNGDTLDENAYSFRFRDSLVWGSDFWNFPTGRYPSIGWIGRVHRGTPWQTVYLKNLDVLQKTEKFGDDDTYIGTNTWAYWTGNYRTTFNGRRWDVANTSPVRDSDLFDLFTTRFNDNAVRGTLSVNQEHLAAWSAALSGLVALTNITETPLSWQAPVFSNLVISPAGPGGLFNSAVGNIVTNINDYRSRFVNADGVAGAFEHAGDVLRVPALSELSPFLNSTDTDQQRYGISDAVYEWLPQQLMGLLRVSTTPRYVIYCYGQALRPAPGGQVLSGNNFGMVTNYQVVAESAARAVIRVDKKGTNSYTATVESYNPLPPE